MTQSDQPVDADRARIERERQFWDHHALTTLRGLPEEDYRTGPDDRHDRTVRWLPYLGMPSYTECLLREIGDVNEKSVLDLGTGNGFLGALLASRGATVDAVDVSDSSLDLARFRASVSGLADRIRFHNMPVESLDFPDESFDHVGGVFLLHHLDLAPGLNEIHRVLRPGGRAVFIETWGRNKLLMAARSGLTGSFGIHKAGSDDEAPLGQTACRILAASRFSEIRYSFPDFLCFRMAGYIPLARRGPIPAICSGLDSLIGGLPGLRSFSYWSVITLQK